MITTRFIHTALLLLASLTGLVAWRSFTLIPTELQCESNPEYMTVVCCILVTPQRSPPLFIEAQMVKEVTDLRLDFAVDMERPRRESISVFRVADIDACKMFNRNLTQPLLRMYRATLRKYGRLPKGCPIPADFHFKFPNITLDPDYLPAYVPEAKFKVVVSFYDGKTRFWRSNMLGKVAHKMSNKKSG